MPIYHPEMEKQPQVDYSRITAEAPGKFILTGEMSVLYDKHAIALTVDMKTTVTVEPNKENKVRLFLDDLQHSWTWTTTEFNTTHKLVTKAMDLWVYKSWPNQLNHLLRNQFQNVNTESLGPSTSSNKSNCNDMITNATKAFIMIYLAIGDSYFKSARAPLDVRIKSDIPVGSGLGSSSSYSVALAAAILRAYRVMAENHIIEKWAANLDRFFHGKSSGIDSNIIVQGGCLQFQSGKVRQVADKVALHVLLIDSGVSRSTADMVDKVRRSAIEQPERTNGIFNSLDEYARHMWAAVSNPNFHVRSIMLHVDANQELLDALGMGHPKLTEIVQLCISHQFSCKLTGAGGGGFAFAPYDPKEDSKRLEDLKSELTKLGFKWYDTAAGVGGLKVTVDSIPKDT